MLQDNHITKEERENGHSNTIIALGRSWFSAANARDGLQGVSNGTITSIKCIAKQEEWLVVITANDGKNDWVWFKGIEHWVDLPDAVLKCLSSDRWKPSRPFDKKGQV